VQPVSGEAAAILETTRQLADTLKKSGLYRDYLSSRIRAESQPELVQSLRAFKKAQAEYENKRLSAKEPYSFDEERTVIHMYTELMLNEDARVFLKNEGALLNLWNQLAEILGGACEIELFNQ
jgi:cell fate (sporulation/competence/biofilm development) regulator YlbF (YheA/YmcA/DUF963 family)